MAESLERRVVLLERLVEYWMRTSACPVPDWWIDEQSKVGRIAAVTDKRRTRSGLSHDSKETP